MVNRNKYVFERIGVIETEEYHKGNYGAPGEGRVNVVRQIKRCSIRHFISS